MNTAHIVGPDSAVYGVGPTPESDADRIEKVRRAGTVSRFIGSVRENEGGGTFGVSSAYRYIVGGYADSVVLRAGATGNERSASALAYAEGKEIGRQYGVGFWRDDTTGRVWLDTVRGFASYVDALVEAYANGEIAIWDRDTETSLVVRYAS